MGYIHSFQVLKLFQVVCFNDISMAFRCPVLVKDTGSVNGFYIMSVTVQAQSVWWDHKCCGSSTVVVLGCKRSRPKLLPSRCLWVQNFFHIRWALNVFPTTEPVLFYRPNTEYAEGKVFTGVCLFTGGVCPLREEVGVWPPEMATAAVGTYPTGMQSCSISILRTVRCVLTLSTELTYVFCTGYSRPESVCWRTPLHPSQRSETPSGNLWALKTTTRKLNENFF